MSVHRAQDCCCLHAEMLSKLLEAFSRPTVGLGQAGIRGTLENQRSTLQAMVEQTAFTRNASLASMDQRHGSSGLSKEIHHHISTTAMSTEAEQDQHRFPPPRPPLQSPTRTRSNPLAATFAYFTEPFAYTARSVARRLSEDDPQTPLGFALSANYNGSMDDPTTGVFQPASVPKRRPSPFQPPPLTPLVLRGYRGGTAREAKLLSTALAEEIRLLVPPRLQLHDRWDLTYSLDQNGSTLSTLYGLCDKFRGRRGGFVVVVRDAGGGVFGAYLSEPPRPQKHYFGSGECYLWKATKLPALPDLSNLPPPPSEDTTHLQRMTTVGIRKEPSNQSLASLNVPSTNGANGHASGTATPDRIRFKAFPYTGENDFTIFCQHEYLSVGGGDGHYGLWLDDNLNKGVSDTCPTFGNEPLSDDGSKFDVLGVEIWYIGA